MSSGLHVFSLCNWCWDSTQHDFAIGLPTSGAGADLYGSWSVWEPKLLVFSCGFRGVTRFWVPFFRASWPDHPDPRRGLDLPICQHVIQLESCSSDESCNELEATTDESCANFFNEAGEIHCLQPMRPCYNSSTSEKLSVIMSLWPFVKKESLQTQKQPVFTGETRQGILVAEAQWQCTSNTDPQRLVDP